MSERQPTVDPEIPERALITGLPAFLPMRMAAELLDRDSDTSVVAVIRAGDAEHAGPLRARFPGRVDLLEGDVSAMDMGLSGSEYTDLTQSLTTIHHLARAPLRESNREQTERLHVGGTSNVVALARECKRLRRLCHWSSVTVAGKRKGVILEEDLDAGQSFHNHHEETLFEAERVVASAKQSLPVTVLRPATVVGDSRTGETGDWQGAYYLLVPLATGKGALPMPVPGTTNAPLHLVPIDYVTAAGYILSRDDRAAGNTYHLADCNPLPARRVFELVAEHAHTKLTRRSVPTGIARTLLRAPGLEKLSRAPRAFLDGLDQQVFYNTRRATALLSEHDVHCPALESYVGPLVEFIRHSRDQGATDSQSDVEVDPFA